MSVTKTWNNQTRLEFRPVAPNGKTACDLETEKENATFWKFTPGGEMTLEYIGDVPFETTPGAYFFVVINTPAPVEEGTRLWRLQSRTEHPDTEQLDVALQAPWDTDTLQHGILKLMITNQAVFPLFLSAKKDQHWSVTIAPVPLR